MLQKGQPRLEDLKKNPNLALKKLFSNKAILGILLKKTTPGFGKIDLTRIIKELLVEESILIEGKRVSGAELITPSQEPALEINGMSPESEFDIHFLVRDPYDVSKVFGVDVELQGYEVSLNREWFYACLALCAQIGNPYVNSKKNQPGVPGTNYDLYYRPITIVVNFNDANPSKRNSIEASVAKADIKMRFDLDGKEFYDEDVVTTETPYEMDPLNIVNINLSGRVGGKIESIFDLLNSLIFNFENQEEIGDYLKRQSVNPDEVLEDKKIYDGSLASPKD